MSKVVYLTGAPISGKSTLVAHLCERHPDWFPFVYSTQLARFLSSKRSTEVTESNLRSGGSAIISPSDIAAVDDELIDFANEHRKQGVVLIDCHAVSKEPFGFRVTPFSTRDFRRLSPDVIVVLYVEPNLMLDRLSKKPDQRLRVTAYEAATINSLQAAVAICYATTLGIPIYFVDSSLPIEELGAIVESHV